MFIMMLVMKLEKKKKKKNLFHKLRNHQTVVEPTSTGIPAYELHKTRSNLRSMCLSVEYCTDHTIELLEIRTCKNLVGYERLRLIL